MIPSFGCPDAGTRNLARLDGAEMRYSLKVSDSLGGTPEPRAAYLVGAVTTLGQERPAAKSSRLPRVTAAIASIASRVKNA